MFDVQLIAAIADKDKFIRISPFIKEHSVSPQAWKIIATLTDYYKAYPSKTKVDWSEFQLFFYAVHKVTGDDRVLADSFFSKVEECDELSIVVEDVLKNYVTKDFATRILNVAADIVQDVGKYSIEDIIPLMDSYHKEMGTSVYVS